MTDKELYKKCKDLVETYQFKNKEDMEDIIRCAFLDCWSYQEKNELNDTIIEYFVKRLMMPPIIKNLDLKNTEGLISI